MGAALLTLHALSGSWGPWGGDHAVGAAEKRNGTKPVLAASPGAVITHFDRSNFRGRGFILVHSAGYRLP